MLVSLEILQQFVDVSRILNLREVFDLLGLEVKNVDKEEKVFNIETLANRGDHLSHYYIAKELSAKLDLTLQEPKIFSGDFNRGSLIQDLDHDCPVFFVAKISAQPFSINDLRIPKPSFLPLDTHPFVYLANYVMWELGQPLHCYDAQSIKLPFSVVKSVQNCEFLALDQKSYKFPANTLFVHDSQKRVAAAGIIGSYETRLRDNSFDIYLESAHFDPVRVRVSRTAAGLSTDASYRFERFVSPTLPELAVRRFLQILASSDLRFSVETLDFKQTFNQARVIELRYQDIANHFGANFDPSESLAMLQKIGFGISRQNGGWVVEVPTHRQYDVSNAEDILEEIARFFDYNKIPRQTLSGALKPSEFPKSYKSKKSLCLFLSQKGFNEVITKSFLSQKEVKWLVTNTHHKNQDLTQLKNSVESSYAFLSPDGILNLLKALKLNIDRFKPCPKLFEITRGFSANYKNLEKNFLNLAFTHPYLDVSRPVQSFESCFFLASVVWNMLSYLRISSSVRVNPVSGGYFDWGFSCTVDDQVLGFWGSFNPSLLVFLDLKSPVLGATFDLDLLVEFSSSYSKIKDAVIYPPAYRDLTVSTTLLGHELLVAITNLQIPFLTDVQIVDYLPNSELPKFTLRFKFQSNQKTLDKSLIDALIRNLVTDLENIAAGKVQVLYKELLFAQQIN